MEGVGVDAGRRGELGDRARPGGERLGDAEVGGDRGSASGQAASVTGERTKRSKSGTGSGLLTQ